MIPCFIKNIFRGRSSRKEYLMPVLLCLPPFCVSGILLSLYFVSHNPELYAIVIMFYVIEDSTHTVFAGWFGSLLFWLLIFLPLILLFPYTMRRLHDIGWSQWFAPITLLYTIFPLMTVLWIALEIDSIDSGLFLIIAALSATGLALIFTLLLLLAPGRKEANVHGEPRHIPWRLLFKKSILRTIPFFLAAYLIIFGLSFVNMSVLRPFSITYTGHGGDNVYNVDDTITITLNDTKNVFYGDSTDGNHSTTGVWSDGTTMWIAADNYAGENQLYAFTLSDGARDAEKDIFLDGTNREARDIWSDGATLWVANQGFFTHIYAYNLTTKLHDKEKDFSLKDRVPCTYPLGMWSDDTTMWISSECYSERDYEGKIYAFNLTDNGHNPMKDIFLDPENTSPHSIWSNGSTMWVTDTDDTTLYAYALEDSSRRAREDVYLDKENADPRGVWSDGTTMWVTDYRDNRVYAYNIESKTRDAEKDIIFPVNPQALLVIQKGNPFARYPGGEGPPVHISTHPLQFVRKRPGDRTLTASYTVTDQELGRVSLLGQTYDETGNGTFFVDVQFPPLQVNPTIKDRER